MLYHRLFIIGVIYLFSITPNSNKILSDPAFWEASLNQLNHQTIEYCKQKEYKEAEKCNNTALQKAKRWLETTTSTAYRTALHDSILVERYKYVSELNRETINCYNTGDYQTAKDINQFALQKGQQLLGKQTPQYVSALYNKAIFLDMEGKNEEAIELYQQIKNLEEVIDVGSSDLSITDDGIGYAYYTLGDYHTALSYSEQAIERRTNANIIDAILVPFISNKALYLESLGDLDAAKIENQNCLNLINQLAEKNSSFVQQVALYSYQNLAKIGLKQQSSTSLIQSHLDNAIKITNTYRPAQKTYCTYQLRGMLYQRKKLYKAAHDDYQMAETLLQQELDGSDIQKDIRLGQLYTQKALAYRAQSLHEKALVYHQKALKAIAVDEDLDIDSWDNPTAEQFINKLHAIEILAAKAQTLTTNRQLKAAYQTYLLAMNLVPDTRRSYKEKGSKYQLAGATIPLYEAAIDVAIQLFEQTKDVTYQKQAFLFSESNKAVLLLEDMLHKKTDAKAVEFVDSTLLKQEQQLRYQINGLERQLFNLKSVSTIKQHQVEKIKILENKLFETKE